jgi:membrane associated rhomboid family serine protease
MGSTNRDYMRDDPDSNSPAWGHDVPTTKWLVIVTIVVFFLQSMMTHRAGFQASSRFVSDFRADSMLSAGMQTLALDPSYVEEWFTLFPDQVLRGQVWRLVTFVFCHERHTAWNLVFNMVALWYLGSVLERMYGSREFLWFYLASAFVCGLIFTGFGLKMFLPKPLMGAGPCVLAMLTLYATHFPRQEILFCWVIPMQIRVLLMIYVAVDAYQILQASAGQGTWLAVAYMSELWGIVFGYVYRVQNWRLAQLGDLFDFTRWKRSLRRASTARSLKVFHPEVVSNLEEQVDAILAKIHEQGSESLTDRERSILQRASEQAKNRL